MANKMETKLVIFILTCAVHLVTAYPITTVNSLPSSNIEENVTTEVINEVNITGKTSLYSDPTSNQMHADLHLSEVNPTDKFKKIQPFTTEVLKLKTGNVPIPSQNDLKKQLGSDTTSKPIDVTQKSIPKKTSLTKNDTESKASDHVKVYSYIVIHRKPAVVEFPNIIGIPKDTPDKISTQTFSKEAARESTPLRGVQLIFAWALIILVCAICMSVTHEKDKKVKPPPYSELVSQQDELDI